MRFIMMVMVDMSVRVVVNVGDRGVLAGDAELRCLNTGAHHLLSPDRLGRDREAAERAANIVERDASVDQGAEHHVA